MIKIDVSLCRSDLGGAGGEKNGWKQIVSRTELVATASRMPITEFERNRLRVSVHRMCVQEGLFDGMIPTFRRVQRAARDDEIEGSSNHPFFVTKVTYAPCPAASDAHFPNVASDALDAEQSRRRCRLDHGHPRGL